MSRALRPTQELSDGRVGESAGPPRAGGEPPALGGHRRERAQAGDAAELRHGPERLAQGAGGQRRAGVAPRAGPPERVGATGRAWLGCGLGELDALGHPLAVDDDALGPGAQLITAVGDAPGFVVVAHHGEEPRRVLAAVDHGDPAGCLDLDLALPDLDTDHVSPSLAPSPA
ncbi:MAG: hypothetical protein DRN81_05135 [Thermoproteota archaeon]|nr:MAG: hypothetical protein DRN81_05135 [Candidatus Korarchaeota archaeon]